MVGNISFYSDVSIAAITGQEEAIAKVSLSSKYATVEEAKEKVEEAFKGVIDLKEYADFECYLLFSNYDTSDGFYRYTIRWHKVENGLYTDFVQLYLYENGNIKSFR